MVVLALGPTLNPAQTASARPQGGGAATFRGGTELVVLPVSVVDASGRLVPDLAAHDFAIYEEGVRQTVTLFSTASAPLDLMFLLDTSASMDERMQATKRAATAFLDTLRPHDRAAVVLFNDRVRIAEALTEDRERLRQAIDHASMWGATALHEALYISLRELALARRGSEELRRQALVVLSDGEDTSSKYVAWDVVLEEARRSAVTIFTIVPGSPGSVWESPERSRRAADFGMRALANETGGRFLTRTREQDLPTVFQYIADELGHQYWLAYVPVVPKVGFRRVSVRVITRPELRAKTRSGYYGSGHRRDVATHRSGRKGQ